MRDQRKVDLERHVAEVNDLLRKANKDSDDETSAAEDEEEEWDGIASPPRPSIDGVDEYVDEDKYTTVTIEAMEDAKAFTKGSDDEEQTTVVAENVDSKDGDVKKKTVWSKGKKVDPKNKPKKKKFRYESKGERKETRNKQKAKNAAAKKARTGK